MEVKCLIFGIEIANSVWEKTPFPRGDATDLISYLIQHQKLFGLIKSRRKRHREIDAYNQHIWALYS